MPAPIIPVTKSFQFHKVRLKEKLELFEEQVAKFQFHKVRLKVAGLASLMLLLFGFNSIRYD